MFEKEGIKYALEETIGTECLSKPIEDFSFIDLADEQQEKAQCYKDGAEFGYNKAKEEMQEQGLALQSDMDKTIEQNIALKKELNKANEWHFVKDGDLPKNNIQVLVLLENERLKTSIFMENKFTVWDKDYKAYTKLYNVIAWKEIVLPEGE